MSLFDVTTRETGATFGDSNARCSPWQRQLCVRLCGEEVVGPILDTVNLLVEFEDTQAATYLLRVSYSIVRAVHFMRTTPLEQWQEQAVKFDLMMRSAIERILADPMSDETYAQACLTPRLGGLGLRKVVEHAGLAYHASWHEAQKTAKEVWVPPAALPEKYLSQKDASFE